MLHQKFVFDILTTTSKKQITNSSSDSYCSHTINVYALLVLLSQHSGSYDNDVPLYTAFCRTGDK